jgi:hypothetical protein
VFTPFRYGSIEPTTPPTSTPKTTQPILTETTAIIAVAIAAATIITATSNLVYNYKVKAQNKTKP